MIGSWSDKLSISCRSRTKTLSTDSLNNVSDKRKWSSTLKREHCRTWRHDNLKNSPKKSRKKLNMDRLWRLAKKVTDIFFVLFQSNKLERTAPSWTHQSLPLDDVTKYTFQSRWKSRQVWTLTPNIFCRSKLKKWFLTLEPSAPACRFEPRKLPWFSGFFWNFSPKISARTHVFGFHSLSIPQALCGSELKEPWF